MNYKNTTLLRVTGEKLPLIPMPSGQKFPAIKWKELRTQEPMSYREDFSNANIALLTGNTPYYNFIAFDFDCYGDTNAIERAMKMVNQTYGNLPWEESHQQTTPSGGKHYIFKAPLGVEVKSTTDLLKDKEHCVDIRAEGGLLVLAPSEATSKVSGVLMPYVHSNEISLENAVMLSGDVCQKLNMKEAVMSQTQINITSPLPQTTQMTNCTVAYFNEAISRAVSNLMMTSQGSRNSELNRQAFKLGQFIGAGIISYYEAHTMLAKAAELTGLSASEINATLASGLHAGAQKPVELPQAGKLTSDWYAEHQISSIWSTPQPLEAPLSSVLPLSEDMLPKDMYEYAKVKALNLDNAPIEFVAIPLLISYAATLGTSHVIKPKAKDLDWKETAVLWGGLIAPPSAKKSPCLSLGTKPTKKVQEHLTKEHNKALKETKVKTKLIEKKAKTLEDEAHEAFELGNEELANQKLTESEELRSQIIKPVERKIVINDATIEAIGVRLSGTKDGILMLRDELSGLLVDFKDERSASRPFYLEAYNGNHEFITERISREQVYIPRLAVWVCGGIQPDKLMPFLYARKHNGDNDGFLERMQLLVMPDVEKPKYVDNPTELEEVFLVENVNDAFLRAATIGFDENGNSRIVSFSESAQEIWAAWVQTQHEQIMEEAKDMQPVFGKHIGLCARLALVYHMFNGGTDQEAIQDSTLKMAIHMVEFLKSHQNRIFGFCEKTVIHDLSKDFLIKLAGLPNPFTPSDVSDKKWASFGKDNRDMVLDNLCKLGYLLRLQNKSKQGRPTILYYKHPEYCGV
ncbi:DUF3987 domain-containing protein [Vibrio ponticus]|nr:DUF3987 domain-containing protein [Vibrio ponticus]